MKLKADNINSELSRGLASVYFIAGDEPFLTAEVGDAIRAAAREQGFTERESHLVTDKYDWGSFRAGLNNLSLFGERKLIDMRLPTGKPGREGGAILAELAAQPPGDNLFLITAPRLDKKSQSTKWATNIQRSGVWVDVYTPSDLSAWLHRHMEKVGVNCDAEGLELLVARIEGNLMAADQELRKLKLLYGDKPVNAEAVARSVADGARFDVFQLADAAINQDAARAVRIFYGLRREGTAVVLTSWAVIRAANTLLDVWARTGAGQPVASALKAARVWSSHESFYRRALSAHDEKSLRRLAAKAAQTDRTIKSTTDERAWQALLELVLLISRPGNPVLTGFAA